MEALAGTGLGPAGGTGERERALVFVGFMGAGKSSAARAVAEALRVDAVDSDRELERELGEPLESFFDREGEAAFRAREEGVVVRLLGRRDLRIAALGGGALGSEAVRRELERHLVVHIDAEPDEAWRRASGKGRPLARDRARFDRLHAERRALYESAADALLPPDGRDVARRALPALTALRDGNAPAGTRLIWARAASGDYPVYAGRGLLERGFFHPSVERRFLVTDEKVGRELPEAAGALASVGTASIPPGESEKTLARAEQVLRAMAVAGVRREDVVVALGGGVVGDLGAFCAAVYQRGVACVQVPTTLVAQVDSAYGGKTGVDLPEGKNYAGVYHQPAAVLVDHAALDSLPPEERAAGYAEVVKTALIAGGSLWERVRQGGEPDDQVVIDCARTKLAVVAHDERDTGRRQVLNLGHTVGHALEAATGFARLRHGEAVGLGLLCALALSGQDELRDEVAELLAARGLPLRVEDVDVDDVVALVGRDKKRRDEEIPFVLVDAPGEVSAGRPVADAELRAAVDGVIA